VTAAAPAPGAPDAAAAARPARAGGRGWRRDLVRSAAAPVITAVVLGALLSAWVAAGGAGTVSRIRIEVTLAVIPMTSYAPHGSAGPATTYLTIRNLAAAPDQLTGASSPAARRVFLTRHGTAGRAAAVTVPAHGAITLSPLGQDLVLAGTRDLMDGQHVPLTLVFRRAGRVTIMATVTAPGSP
jgi:copper(I)-binding protein